MLAVGLEGARRWSPAETVMMRMAAKDPGTGRTQQVNTAPVGTQRTQKFLSTIRWTEVRLTLPELLSKSY